MADLASLRENLQTYQLQLDQVEAALLADPNNEELNKLKVDLTEVLTLTKDLLSAQLTSSAAAVSTSPKETSSSSRHNPSRAEAGPSSSGAVIPPALSTTPSSWTVGQKCSAPWSENGKYHNALIEHINTVGEVTVKFLGYDERENVMLEDLREFVQIKKKVDPKQREQLKIKKQKKIEKLAEKEKVAEQQRNSWQNFRTKGLTKKKKGFIQSSIFATTDAVKGKVGIGTCGTSGKEMTSFENAPSKWRKN